MGPLALVIVSNAIAAVALLVALAAFEQVRDTNAGCVACSDTEMPAQTVAPDVPADAVVDAPISIAAEPSSRSDDLAAAGVEPATPPIDWGAIAAETPADPPPQMLGGVREALYDRHYWVSDEWNLQLFRPEIEGLGGGYMGVGTDQNYLLMGWSDPDVAWIIDYDAKVIELHGVYADFFRAATTPEDFVSLWSKERESEAMAILDARPDPRAASRGKAVYKRAIGRIRRRFNLLVPKLRALGVSSYLTDQAVYDRVRELVVSGRVKPTLVDLNGKRGARGIAALLEAHDTPLRILYLSNAEQYWNYERPFRENIAALPFDDRSVVLRTIASHKTNGDFRYNVHLALDYQKRVQEVDRVYRFVTLRRLEGRDDVDFSITPSKVARAQAKRVEIEAQDGSDLILDREPEVDPEPAAVPVSAPPIPAAESGDFMAHVAIPCWEAPEGMACIPGGSFERGIDHGERFAQPAERVWLQTFFMDRHEVTFGDYKACESEGLCPKARPRYADFNDPEQPMNGVSWYDAVAYCEARGKHLPTEAQWEKAARGTEGWAFPWGNEPANCTRAVIRDAKGAGCGVAKRFGKPEVGKPAPVGSRPPNQYGLYDMAGNAYEWVADWFVVSYAKCGEDCRGVDPKGPCAGQQSCDRSQKKVVRGGSWFWPAAHATAFHRRAHTPQNEPFHHFGFRCAAGLAERTELMKHD